MDDNPMRISPFSFKILSRMQLVSYSEVIPDRQRILNAMFDPSFDPGRKVFLESDPNLLSSHERVEGKVEWTDLSTDKIEITAQTNRPTLLLITDNYSAGWKAKSLPGSDQSKYYVMPADYFLRAIPLTAGKHHFMLEYRPTAFEIGKWVSILSCILYFGVLLFCSKKSSLLMAKVTT